MADKKKTSRRKSAVAIKYSPPENSAPVVAAKGHGLIAQKIIELAHKHNIPIKEDPDLVQVLSQLDLNEKIPASVYKAVAEILAFVYTLNDKWKETQR